MKFGIAKFSADLCAAISADNEARLAGSTAASTFDSPIEALFYTAFYQAIHLHPRYRGMEMLGLSAIDAGDTGGDVYLGWQVRVLDWPVDFAIQVRPRWGDETNLARLVVECDGHDFHERTKEQAKRDRSRDRALQAAGWTVMRFTGSEIYRDPMKCAAEALNWCLLRTDGAQS